MMKYLITFAPGFTPEMFKALEDLGLELICIPGAANMHNDSERNDIADYSDVDMILCYQYFNYHDVTRFTNLKYVHTTCSGLDHMPMEYLHSKGVTVNNARGVYSIPMAEYALNGVLQIYKGGTMLMDQQRNHVWQRFDDMRELTGNQVTLLGTGSVATECAKRFTAMGCRCVGLCRHPKPDAEFFDAQLHINCLDDVLPETDILLLTLPLTDETRGIMNARRFALLKPDAVMVNIARGPVVETDAMVDALESGRLSGAVVDVFDPEPLPADSPLWDVKNLILTPHNSFAGEGNPRRMFDLVYQDTVNWLKSKGE